VRERERERERDRERERERDACIIKPCHMFQEISFCKYKNTRD
jgi:hypothetical protein